MILRLNSQEFVSLYRAALAVPTVERDVDLDESVRKMEEVLHSALGALDDRESMSGFDRWVESEKNKIEGLQEELDHIKETIPREVLVAQLKPLTKEKSKRRKSRGRPKVR